MLIVDSPRDGGGEGVLRQMAQAALEAGDDVVLAGRPAWLVERLAADVPGIRARVISAADFRAPAAPRERVRRLIVQLRELGRAVRAERPDIVQSSNGGYPGSALCLLVLPLARALWVPRRFLAVHAVPRPRPSSRPLAAAHALVDRLVWRSAQGVWGGTDVVGRGLERLRGMPPERYHRIPYGVPATAPGADGRSLRASWSRGPDDLVVGMVAGTSDAQKGHAVLVEALGATPKSVRAVVVGADPPPEALARAETLGLGDRLIVAGRLPDLAAAYRAFDVLCVPSVADESLPLVVLEAFAAGVPVIASDLSGLPEAVEDGRTGRLFAPGDWAALAAQLAEADGEPETIARWGRQARAAWEERYSLPAMRAGLLALWEGR